MVSIKFALSFLLFSFLCNDALSTNYGARCRGMCQRSRGFIDYKRPGQSSTTTWVITTRSRDYTTFVLHLKNIRIRTVRDSWLEITQAGYVLEKTHRIKNNAQQIMVFRDTYEVRVRVLSFANLQFRLNYFIGCDVLEGSNITLQRQASEPQVPTTSTPASHSSANNWYNYFGGLFGRRAGLVVPWYTWTTPQQSSTSPQQRRAKCWLVVPLIEEETGAQIGGGRPGFAYNYNRRENSHEEVQETHVIMKNLNLANDSSIQVDDLITGNSLMSFNESSTLEMVNLKKKNRRIMYNLQRRINTAMFIDLQCEGDSNCDETEFTFASVALENEDIECLERERKCRLNVGDQNVSCTPPSAPPLLLLTQLTLHDLQQTECPAYIYIDSLINTVTNDNEEDPNVTGRLGGLERLLSRCSRFDDYCSGRKCITFQNDEGCHIACMIIKHKMRMCNYINSIFA